MIDWVTCQLPLLHEPLDSGAVFKVDQSGEVEWHTRCRVQVEGSHSSSIQVRSIGSNGAGQATGLSFSGNPSKFLQGHNIFGSDDLVSLMYDAFRKLLRVLHISPQLSDLRAVKQGAYPVSTVDINQSFELPTRQDVLAWIRAAEYKSKTRHGRPSMKGSTLYWGKSSQRWALKTYSKGEEIQAPKHRLPVALSETPLAQWADNKLRIELRLKKKMLSELNVTQANELTILRARDLFNDFVRKLEMSEQVALTSERQLDLPQRLRSTYILWRNGEDLRYTLPKPTYYRHRKELLGHGIDIALRADSLHKSNVVPLIRVLEATPAQVPSWAFEQALVHHSARC
jgi:II/X family phage/plasmid replication protein